MLADGLASRWLSRGGLAGVCIETRQANAAMKTMPNKTDRNDARALAQIMRAGWFLQVHVKSRQCRLWCSLLVARRTVLNKMHAIENVVRGILREAGLKLGTPGRAAFAGRVRKLAEGAPLVMQFVEPLLAVLASMLTELAFRATIDRPDRFRRSRDMAAHLGLTSARYQSGETDIQGKLSRCGDELARTALYEAAHTLLARSHKWTSPRAWGMKIARHRGRARVRVTRRYRPDTLILETTFETAEGKATLIDFMPPRDGAQRSGASCGRRAWPGGIRDRLHRTFRLWP